jgi:hypothetical protein
VETYFVRKLSIFGINFPNIPTNPVQNSALASLLASRSATTSRLELNTVKQAQFRSQLRKK